MSLARAWCTLFWLSLRRLFWSSSTLMVCVPLVLGALRVLRLRFDRMGNTELAFQRLSDFLIMLFASFLVPICALAYGTTSVGGDREDRTLLFLLVRPVPRPLVLLAKYAAALPLTLGMVGGSFLIYCWLAGEIGAWARTLYLPTVLAMSLAYLGLFHLFAVALRHSTIAALVYALFFELIMGGLPGVVKRLAVNYYGRSLLYAAGAKHGVERPDWFEPISTTTAGWALFAMAAGSLLLALLVFQRREYRDLT